jgi:hypothetical protein
MSDVELILRNNSNSTLSSTANTVAIVNLGALQDTQKLSPLYCSSVSNFL